MTWTATVNEDRCISSRECIRVSSEAFYIDDDGVSQTTPAAAELDEATAMRAVKACPVSAISAQENA